MVVRWKTAILMPESWRGHGGHSARPAVPERIERLFVCCRTRKHFTAWCRDEGVPPEGEHILWVNDLSTLAGHSGMHYHALMNSPDWQELAAGCYALGGRWVLGGEINLWSERVRAAAGRPHA